MFAASSLTAVFTDEIGPAFENANPGVKVVFNFGASDSLAGQIQSEGSADVFASASGTWMDAIAEDPGVTGRTDFAQNRLVIVTPPDDPAGISSIEDLANPGVQLVLAATGVPVGDYAREALDNAGILADAEANVVSNEEDNASVVAKVAAGEADAAIVYVSDVSGPAGHDLRSVEIPDDVNVIATLSDRRGRRRARGDPRRRVRRLPHEHRRTGGPRVLRVPAHELTCADGRPFPSRSWPASASSS